MSDRKQRRYVSAIGRRWRRLAAKIAIWPGMRYFPPLDRLHGRMGDPQLGPWPTTEIDVPAPLRSTPGTVRVADLENAAHQHAPLRDFMIQNRQLMNWLQGHLWHALVPVAPRTWRARAAARRRERSVHPRRRDEAPEELTALLKQRAAGIGLSAVGVTSTDERYMFDEWDGTHCGDRVIVCVLEQDWAATQTIPSNTAELAAIRTYAECVGLMTQLAQVLTERGHRVQVHDAAGPAMTIHFAVEAGLGQLGLNGQLLTPHAGSRCRIMLMITDAPLVPDEPKDFGVPKLCDACQICVRRCPPGAIPANRVLKRGVEKAPINTKRCLPVVAQAEGCAVCMKVCPVQRYGLAAVHEEFERTGQVLGKETDELEGYRWPLDGTYYGPGRKPRMTPGLTKPPDMPRLDLMPTLSGDGQRRDRSRNGQAE